jgi:hydantoinase/carbamoylase family amidase
MHLRRDALAGAARIALELRDYARAGQSITANVGRMTVEPGGGNVVPGVADFTIDVRATTAAEIRELEQFVEDTVARIGAEEGLSVELSQTFSLDPLELDTQLVEIVAAAAAAEGARAIHMPSGAGHDAMIVGSHVPAAMIFVPSYRGISHSPDEQSDPADLELGMRVLASTLRQSLSS